MSQQDAHVREWARATRHVVWSYPTRSDDTAEAKCLACGWRGELAGPSRYWLQRDGRCPGCTPDGPRRSDD